MLSASDLGQTSPGTVDPRQMTLIMNEMVSISDKVSSFRAIRNDVTHFGLGDKEDLWPEL